MAIAFPSTAHAIEWRFAPSLTASATYTDNANQSQNNPDNAFILTTTPGFSLRSEGSRRLNAFLQYGATAVERFGSDQSDDLYHNLSAVAKAELVEDFLYLDGTARISQELISLLGSPADATINGSNRATVGSYSISPHIQKRLGTFAYLQARYTNSGAIFENQTVADTSANALNASLTSGTRFDDLSWGLNYSIRKAENRNGPTGASNADTTLESASATAGYALTRKFRVFGSVGHDWNDYLSTTNTSGASYSVGFGWAPTRRTSFEASAGERYFGRTFSVAGSHRTRASHWNVRYSEGVSDISQRITEDNERLYWLCMADPLLRPATTDLSEKPDACDGPYPFGSVISKARLLFGDAYAQALQDQYGTWLANGIFINKTLNAGVSWDVRRWVFGVNANDTRRLYQILNNPEDHLQSLSGYARYQISPRLSASGSLIFARTSLERSAVGGQPREDDTVTLNVGLTQRFAENFLGSLTFRHTERSSNAANSDYKENALTALVNLRF